jgi:glyoxylase-like metal-dependent hydrolase (beta-lactamase superfamily II)
LSTTTVTTTSGIGRSDLLGGNKEELQASLKFITELLPDETVIYPGHGKKSTIGYEKANNPYIVQIYKLA